MEEYLDRVDKQQEVFPDDSIIDTRPLNVPAVIDIVAVQKKYKPKKHGNQKKRRKSWQQGKKKHHQHSTTKKISMKETTDGPKDLQQQLRDLQQKEERDRVLKEEPHVVEKNKYLQQKKKLQEQRQIKQHIKEIQLHIQQQAEEIKLKQKKERERNAIIQRKKVQEIQRQSRQKQNMTNIKQSEDKQQNKIINQIKVDHQTTVKNGEEFHVQEVKTPMSTESKIELHKKPPDSKILRSIMSLQEKTNSEHHTNFQNNLVLQPHKHQPYLLHQRRVLTPNAKIKPMPVTKRESHKIPNTGVPKLS